MEILLACRVMENFQEAKTAASGLDKFVDYHIGPPIMHWGPMSYPSESSKCVFMKIHFIGRVRKFSDPNILERQLPWTYEKGEK